MIGANPLPCGCRRLLALLVLVAPALTAPLAAQSNLDPTFGSNGKVITPIGTADDYASAIAVQADGRIVVVGSCRTSSGPDFWLGAL